ncbi:MAG: hypothetical protein GTO45_05600 [Candidatus Aminicenantes bacterium]|nr:hypothetical protein [Candidatus Aminicenantes bacterium]NIN17561.1 hypothetical protein [Candidatus Aminicenantes bacterium]NIN48110.1 hypothetical protein [Candidatus Aminicenantes bacterium]NIN84213.1 hypothetical protein [Candidatus Aminicenantes bacterium]NIO80317.1 hypothetical protein [Candidatus Aminicenantes bacterium]
MPTRKNQKNKKKSGQISESISCQFKEIVDWYNMIDFDQVEVDIRIKKK